MSDLDTSLAVHAGGLQAHRNHTSRCVPFEPPAALLARLDREADGLWTSRRGRGRRRMASDLLRSANLEIRRLLEGTGHITAYLVLASAAGRLSAHMVQLASG